MEEMIPGDREELDWQTNVPRQYGMLTMNSDETPTLLSQLITGVNDTIRNRTEYFGSKDKIVIDKIETGAGGDAMAVGAFNGKPFEYTFDGIDTPFAALPEEIEIYLDIRR